MSDMTEAEYLQKIERVTKDIEGLRSSGDGGRKLEALIEYRNYLEDELKFIKNENRSRTGAR
jgi:hypothetical protein